MLLRSSIFSTKKFFKKTLNTVKSLFSGEPTYSRIPKTSPNDNQTPVDMIKSRELDIFYGEFTDRWDQTRKSNKKRMMPPAAAAVNQGMDEVEKYEGNYENNWKEKGSSYNMGRMRRDEIARKLKEIERMDKNNVEHKLDIEEVIHYYSRLTCPAYIDIVDKFLIDMYAEISSQFKSN